MPRTPPRSLRLRSSFWKTVSIYPISAPGLDASASAAVEVNKNGLTSQMNKK